MERSISSTMKSLAPRRMMEAALREPGLRGGEGKGGEEGGRGEEGRGGVVKECPTALTL